MTREWAQFWTAMAAIVVAATAWAMAAIGWNVGSLGEWIGGLGAFAAAAVALWIADSQQREARAIEKSRSSEQQAAVREQRLKAVDLAAKCLSDVYEYVLKVKTGVEKYPDGRVLIAKAILGLPRLSSCGEMMDRFDLSQIDHSRITLKFVDARHAITVAMQQLQTLTEDDLDDATVARFLDFAMLEKRVREMWIIRLNVMANRALDHVLAPDAAEVIDEIMQNYHSVTLEDEGEVAV